MKLVLLNRKDFEYDIYSLIKAFFHKDDIKILTIEDRKEQGRLLENLEFGIVINYEIDGIQLSYFRYGKQAAIKNIRVDYQNRLDTKNRLKRLLYRFLSQMEKKTLPWGTLTGIRPVKIPLQMLNKGCSENEIRQYMKDTYLLCDEKTSLSISVAKREKKILNKKDFSKGYSLYIGIPFCPTTCLYCSFTSYPIGVWRNKVWDYLYALEKEIKFTAEVFRHKSPDTIYIGGGTPTTLTAEQLDYLLSLIAMHFPLEGVREFTVEAGRPDSITEKKLEMLKKHGVDRISVNPQTLNQETLNFIGRLHTVEQFVDAYFLARQVGFVNINMDIIIGLPKETIEHVTHTMNRIEELEPDSLTVHSLAVKRASKLRRMIDDEQLLSMVNTEEIMHITRQGAAKLNMEPYYLYRQKNIAGNLENIGYAKEDKYGIYNIVMMEEVQTIAALGAGSVSKYVYPLRDKIERNDNVKDVSIYIDEIEAVIHKKRIFYDRVVSERRLEHFGIEK